jgi:putative hydrolase of the HAD superfamily
VVIKGIVFDLDDTIYPEREYVRSGFAIVAARLGQTPAVSQRLFDWLWQAFETGVRGATFDRMLEVFPELRERTSVAEVVEMYRAHRPAIALGADLERVLDGLRSRGLRLGVLTDGPARSQAAKAEALGLDRWFDPIILTAAHGDDFEKPNSAGFESIARSWGMAGHQLAYVGDNPAKDFAGPRRLGWRTIRVRHAGQLHYDAEPAAGGDRPDVEIRVVTDVLDGLS